MLSYRQLEAFYWVAKLGTMSAGADKLHTSQSAITKRIQRLEETLETPLFTRSGRRNVLTRNGREVLGMAERMLSERDALMARFVTDTARNKRMALGVTEITAITWLPSWVERLKDYFPGIELEVVISMTAELQELLSDNKIQMAVMLAPTQSTSFLSVPLGYLDLAWMGGPEMDGSRTYSQKEIADLPIIRQNHESALSNVYDDWLSPYNASKDVFTINSLIATASMISAGQGISCLPLSYFKPMLAAKKLVRLPTEPSPPILLYTAQYRTDSDVTFHCEVARIARSTCNFSQSIGSDI